MIQCLKLIKICNGIMLNFYLALIYMYIGLFHLYLWLLFLADSQSQISVTSTLKVVLIGKLSHFHKAKLYSELFVDITGFLPCSNSLSMYVSLPGIHHYKHVSFSF